MPYVALVCAYLVQPASELHLLCLALVVRHRVVDLQGPGITGQGGARECFVPAKRAAGQRVVDMSEACDWFVNDQSIRLQAPSITYSMQSMRSAHGAAQRTCRLVSFSSALRACRSRSS